MSRSQIEDAEDEIENEAEEADQTIDENKMKLPAAETLDICMDLLFEYFHDKLKPESKVSLSEQKQIESAIFKYFDEQILKTQNSKHVQFLFFYIASFKVSNTSYFRNNQW